MRKQQHGWSPVSWKCWRHRRYGPNCRGTASINLAFMSKRYLPMTKSLIIYLQQRRLTALSLKQSNTWWLLNQLQNKLHRCTQSGCAQKHYTEGQSTKKSRSDCYFSKCWKNQFAIIYAFYEAAFLCILTELACWADTLLGIANRGLKASEALKDKLCRPVVSRTVCTCMQLWQVPTVAEKMSRKPFQRCGISPTATGVSRACPCQEADVLVAVYVQKIHKFCNRVFTIQY